ncbi:hypothetical protein KEJ49_05905 [Candidatus Bathyarchaeota archaeon]|nr:hypothetical protein [Candidatus Bathyarchaeota archaeon]
MAVAHCILNQATRWWNEEKGRDPSKGCLWKVVKRLDELGFGVYQLPCPEITFLGNPRRSMMRGEYESLKGYQEHVKRLSLEASSGIEALINMSRRPRLKLMGLIGLARSPSCAAKGVEPGSYPGGIFFEELLKELKRRGLEPQVIEIDIKDLEASISMLDELVIRSSL